MSYILEALRRSETERKQGQIPDLGNSVQMIHKPRQNRSPWLLWGLLLALVVNGVLLAWLFWPRLAAESSSPSEPPRAVEPAMGRHSPASELPGGPSLTAPTPEPTGPLPVQPRAPLEQPVAESEYPVQNLVASADQGQAGPAGGRTEPDLQPGSGGDPGRAQGQVAANPAERFSGPAEYDAEPIQVAQETVPALGDLPASFQRRVPNLEFNSHIYSARAEARRIMINNAYLREGDQLDSLRIEEITEQGVVLSLQGQPFAMSVVHDWNPPR